MFLGSMTLWFLSWGAEFWCAAIPPYRFDKKVHAQFGNRDEVVSKELYKEMRRDHSQKSRDALSAWLPGRTKWGQCESNLWAVYE